MIFLTSDLHFGHKNVIRYEHRPFADVAEMDETLIRRWNSAVTAQDTVYVLGDVSFYRKEKTADIIGRLNGRKILILGNHDWTHSEQYWREVGFESAYKLKAVMIDNDLWLSHRPPDLPPDGTPWYAAYGHVHCSEAHPTITKNTVCVCTERWNYTPVALERIRQLWKQAQQG